MIKSVWQPPQLRVGGTLEEHRHATWLELFYDLVFVAAIAELAHSLNEEASLSGFLIFVALFIPVWWSWIGSTFYNTRFDCDRDLGHRLLTLAQMAGIVVLAVNVHHGIGESSVGFALSYVAIRSVTIFEYLRAGYYIPIARPLTTRFALGFTLAAGLWLVSVMVPVPWRYGIWALGMGVDLVTPWLVGKLHEQFPPHLSHVPERLGLFTIIVLGESILAVVRGIAEEQWEVYSALEALLGLSIAFSLWWVYFDTVDNSPLKTARAGRFGIGLLWLYSHLPLAIGLAATGVGVEHLVLSDSGVGLPLTERWLLCGPIALCLLALAAIHLITCTLGTTRRKILALYRLGAAAFVLALVIVGESLLPLGLMALVAAACAIPVMLDLQQGSGNSF